MQDRPLPILRCEVILLIRIGDKCVVGGHHRDVQVNKVAEEWGLVGADISLREFLIPMGLNVPVCEHVAGVVLLDASDFNLLETPLWEIHVAGAEVTAETCMSQTECSGEGADPAAIPACGIRHNLNCPMVFVIADGHVTVARHLVVSLSKRCLNSVGVQVPASLYVDETDNVTIANEAEVWALRIIFGLLASRVEVPIVIGILVVIAGDLLLS